MSARFQRLAERERPSVGLSLDGEPLTALAGDTVLVALNVAGRAGPAGFCLTGTCGECRLWRADGRALVACTSQVEDGMALLTSAPAA